MPREKKEVIPPEHCSSVKEYEGTNYWRRKSQSILDDKECRCEICGRKRWKWMPRKKKWKRLRFVSHHVTYVNCPNEKREDFMILCNLCHTMCHDILRYENIHFFYGLLAKVVRQFFKYEGIDTFQKW